MRYFLTARKKNLDQRTDEMINEWIRTNDKILSDDIMIKMLITLLKLGIGSEHVNR